ncbi:MAG: methylmalonyl-CoA mutase family protein [Xanthobacteraceae bacterium]|jgi:methylmalonyl-CoA mutase
MTDPEKTLPLAADFPPATREEWRKLVDAVLKGAPFERLVSTTYDGLSIEPLAARRSDARPIAARPGATAWEVLARIDQPDPALANEAALRELANGASGLSLVFAGAVGDYGFGLPAREGALARVLEGVDLTGGLAIELDLSPHAEAVIDAALAKGFPLSPRATRVRLGHDPLGAMATAGGAARPWSEEAPHFARRLAALAREGFHGMLAAADGRVIHNAGGSEAQELAFVLGVALAYLRALEAAGSALEAARRWIFFRLAADADQFLTIAKFRALRKLWASVEAACGLAPEPAFVSAETAWRMMAQRDPHVNILRATIAVAAAAFGGADAITVLPFTAARGLPDRFARRIARNTQLILIEEAHLAKVADPAAGSGAVEDLTDQLCRTAWAQFREIEAAGGVAAALESGLIQGEVAAVRAKRAAALARRQDALTGVSVFPNLNEADVSVLEPIPVSPTRHAQKQMFEPLPRIRFAVPFEALRDASDRLLAATGARPKIFLAALGTPADFSPRATFARNFFAAGGIEPVDSESLDLPALAAAYKAAGAALACLCSADKVYEKQAAAAAQALKAAGARHIYLAGRPGEREAALRAAGVQSFIYEGCDALATLESAYDILGIETG